ncbi:hypothetical protein J2S53_002567 [Actinopolyspora lacussalsi]|nr:hypothetical protein [Actinopolyspora lacussalsi]
MRYFVGDLLYVLLLPLVAIALGAIAAVVLVSPPT